MDSLPTANNRLIEILLIFLVALTVNFVLVLYTAKPIVTVLILIPCGILGLSLLRRPSYLVWMLIPLLWIHHSSITMLLGVSLSSALLWLEYVMRTERKLIKLGETPFLILIMLTSFIFSLILNGSITNRDIIGQWIWDFGIILLYVLVTKVTHNEATIRNFVKYLLLVISIPALSVVFEGITHPGIRATGFVDVLPTGAAYNLCAFVPLALGAIRGTNLGRKSAMIAAIVFAAVYYTGSRGPFAAIVIASIPFLIEYRFSLAIGGIAFIGIVGKIGGGLASRLDEFSGGNILIETSTIMRFLMWSVAFNIISNNPMIGIGLGKFEKIAFQQMPLTDLVLGQPHNALLNKMVQIGIPLTIILFSTITYIMYRNFRIFKQINNESSEDKSLFLGLLLAPIPMIICMMTDSILNGYAQPFIFWVLLALQTSWGQIMKNKYLGTN
jgi:hypothetical protein